MFDRTHRPYIHKISDGVKQGHRTWYHRYGHGSVFFFFKITVLRMCYLQLANCGCGGIVQSSECEALIQP